MGYRTMILEENRSYWTDRAAGYSEVSKLELSTAQRQKWKDCLYEELAQQFPDRAMEDLRVLEVGTGPGFFAILLCELGCDVTAVDLTPAMLEEAKKNAGALADKINFIQGDAMNLPFEDESFDVVFSRNLTWNLPHPDKAYDQWIRVLKAKGLMMVFDANWYTYLIDENKRKEYMKDRENVKLSSLEDYNIGANFDTMEQIAFDMPLTHQNRPAWDVEYLNSIHAGSVSSVEDIGSILYSEKEKINYCSTPMFLVKAVKG